VVRNYDSRWLDLFEAFDLQVISSASWGAQRIEELLYHQQLRTVFSAGNGEVEVYEFTVPQQWDGKTLRELTPQEGATPVALTRSGRAILLEWDTPLSFRDVVLMSASQEGIEAVRKQLKVLQGG
jgi:trk system potassium uptake protein TrkA